MRFDSSDEEWALLAPHFPKNRKSARADNRKIMNAIFYVLRIGGSVAGFSRTLWAIHDGLHRRSFRLLPPCHDPSQTNPEKENTARTAPPKTDRRYCPGISEIAVPQLPKSQSAIYRKACPRVAETRTLIRTCGVRQINTGLTVKSRVSCRPGVCQCLSKERGAWGFLCLPVS